VFVQGLNQDLQTVKQYCCHFFVMFGMKTLFKYVLIACTYCGVWQVITQPAHGPPIQITQVPVSSVAGKLPQSLHSVTPLQTAIAITTGTTRTGKLKPDFIFMCSLGRSIEGGMKAEGV